jgi:hypothetical protein
VTGCPGLIYKGGDGDAGNDEADVDELLVDISQGMTGPMPESADPWPSGKTSFNNECQRGLARNNLT